MRGDHLRIVTDNGTTLGQAVRFGRRVLVSLHVVDLSARSTLWLTDGRSEPLSFEIDDVRAEIQGDVGAVSTIPAQEAPENGLSWTDDVERIGAARIVANVDASSGGGSIVTIETGIVALRSVDRYSYRLASNADVSLEGCSVAFLSSPVPRGWSGASVLDRKTDAIFAVIHGNAEANDGNAICLLPSREFWLSLDTA